MFRKKRLAIAVVGTAGLAVLATGIHQKTPQSPTTNTPAQAKAKATSLEAAGATEAWVTQVLPNLMPEAFSIKPEGEGFVALVPSGLRADFTKKGQVTYVLEKTSGKQEVSMQLSKFGRESALRAVSEPTTELKANNIFFHFSDPKVSEFYTNLPNGVEQSILVKEKPEGNGQLVIQMKLASVLKPEAYQDGVRFLSSHDGKEYSELSFGQIFAKDATGKSLATKMKVLSKDALAYYVDDKDAQYPVTVDPIAASPAWSYESNQAYAHLGGPFFSNPSDPTGWPVSEKRSNGAIAGTYLGSAGTGAVGYRLMNHNQGASIAGIGDTNGDGYADVAVAAPFYDYNNYTNNGVVFIFHGSSSGLPTTPNKTLYGNISAAMENAEFGYAVAGVGDVNSDGYADIADRSWIRSYSNPYGRRDSLLDRPYLQRH